MARLPFRRSKAETVELPGRPADPAEEPSVEWGWHRSFPRAAQIAGWVSAASLLLMLIGNHEGQVEDAWLIGLAVVLIAALVRDQLKRRTSWRQ